MRALLLLLLSASLVFAPIDVEARQRGAGGSSSHHHAIKKQKTYQTYSKAHLKTRKAYTGRTSGTGDPEKNVLKRDQNHHRNKDGFGPAKLDRSSSNKDAIRGREQQQIEKHRRAGNAADQINGISPKNPKREHYLNEAKKEFGE